MTRLLYVAPTAQGNGNGLSEVDAAGFLDFSEQGFWRKTVTASLELDHVNVAFLNGEYAGDPACLCIRDYLSLLCFQGYSHPSHQLILQGQSENGVVFNLLPPDDPEHTQSTICIRNASNIIIRNLSFKGVGRYNYALFLGNKCRNILIEHCHWFDLPNTEYAAIGVDGADTRQVIVKNCTFKRVGPDSHAHMMYISNNCHHIRVNNCSFEDCSGDYVRFRNNVEYGIVSGCQFLSTGTYPQREPVSRPFVTIAVFNDCKPGTTTAPPGKPTCPDPLNDPQYEYFGTNYIITNNRFIYKQHPGYERRHAISFYHVGYDPPGRNHLMTAAQGDLMEQGTAQERKALLKENCGIDGDKIIVYNNNFLGEEKQLSFGSSLNYGAESKGWEGDVTIDDIINEDSITTPPRWLEAVVGMMMR